MKNKIKCTSTSLTKSAVSFNEETDYYELQINGIKFPSKEKDHFFVPSCVIQRININEFPKDVLITPYFYVYENHATYWMAKIDIMNLGNLKALVQFESTFHPKELSLNINIEEFQAVKSELLLTQKSYCPKIESKKDDEDGCILNYSIELPAGKIKVLMDQAIKFDNDLLQETIGAFPLTMLDALGQLLQYGNTKENSPIDVDDKFTGTENLQIGRPDLDNENTEPLMENKTGNVPFQNPLKTTINQSGSVSEDESVEEDKSDVFIRKYILNTEGEAKILAVRLRTHLGYKTGSPKLENGEWSLVANKNIPPNKMREEMVELEKLDRLFLAQVVERNIDNDISTTMDPSNANNIDNV